MGTPSRFEATVANVIRHGPNVASYLLAVQGRRIRFKPGQFVHLTLETYDPSLHWPESRAFSIASGPSSGERLRLTISRQGAYTSRILDEVEEGRTLWLKGPYGEFTVAPREGTERVVLVAGGTGITPFCAYMEEEVLRPEKHVVPVVLHYGARSPDLLVYRDLADRCAAAVTGFSVRYYLETPNGFPRAIRGRLDIDRIVGEQAAPGRCLYYLSGPKPMISAFSCRLRRDLRVPEDRVLIDAWD